MLSFRFPVCNFSFALVSFLSFSFLLLSVISVSLAGAVLVCEGGNLLLFRFLLVCLGVWGLALGTSLQHLLMGALLS